MLVLSGALGLISSAVTPAVMISATAILVGGVSSKHSSTSDRLRALTAEYRHPSTTDERRKNIEWQSRLFLRRLNYISIAHVLLYAATAVFAFIVMLISLAALHEWLQYVLMPLFLSGVTMLLVSGVLEIVELYLARQVLVLETGDVGESKTK